MICDVPHEGEVSVIHITDVSKFLENQHTLNRKHNVSDFVRNISIKMALDSSVLCRLIVIICFKESKRYAKVKANPNFSGISLRNTD